MYVHTKAKQNVILQILRYRNRCEILVLMYTKAEQWKFSKLSKISMVHTSVDHVNKLQNNRYVYRNEAYKTSQCKFQDVTYII